MRCDTCRTLTPKIPCAPPPSPLAYPAPSTSRVALRLGVWVGLGVGTPKDVVSSLSALWSWVRITTHFGLLDRDPLGAVPTYPWDMQHAGTSTQQGEPGAP